jgi:hypothetical protein
VKIEFFDPPMCCSTGLCGPAPDETQIRLNENIKYLKKKYQDIQIYRYMITQQPLKFRENQDVYKLITQNGKKVLPITTIDGEVIKIYQYPTLDELEKKIEEKKREMN